MNNVYDSLPVDRVTRMIRLVHLDREQPDDNIRCTLERFNLDMCPEYTALSYAWGDPGVESSMSINGRKCGMTILINGRTNKVRANLWEFLIHRRRVGDTGYYWIDAVCIDQNNVDEKTHQVNMMKDIYPGAARVLVWLGRAAEDSDVAMVCLQDLRNYWGQFSRHKKDMNPPWTQAQSKAILSLWERPYWTRVWILQEIILAKQLTVLCGDKSLEWQDFQDLPLKLMYMRSSLEEHFFKAKEEQECLHGLMSSRAAHIIEHRQLWERQKTVWITKTPDRRVAARNIATRASSFKDALEITVKLNCEDVRDKVFALLGIIQMIDPLRVELDPATVADYSKPAVKVFIEVLVYLDTAYTFANILEKDRFADLLESALGLAGVEPTFEQRKAKSIVRESGNMWSQYEKGWAQYLETTYPSIVDYSAVYGSDFDWDSDLEDNL